MKVLWYLIRKDAVVRQCRAADREVAKLILAPQERDAVVSALSYKIPQHPAVTTRDADNCILCYKAMTPDETEADNMHPVCRARYQRGYEAKVARRRAREQAAQGAQAR
jgi:hypothetical protein